PLLIAQLKRQMHERVAAPSIVAAEQPLMQRQRLSVALLSLRELLIGIVVGGDLEQVAIVLNVAGPVEAACQTSLHVQYRCRAGRRGTCLAERGGQAGDRGLDRRQGCRNAFRQIKPLTDLRDEGEIGPPAAVEAA